MKNRRFLLHLFTAVLLMGCADKRVAEIVVGDPRVLALGDLMHERLAIADRVAWAKYQDTLPVLDAAREQKVLIQVVAAAKAQGVDPSLAERFFTAQILASRLRQEELIRIWSRGGTLPTFGPIDLGRDVRPMLDGLTGRMVAALKDFPDSLESREALAGILERAEHSRRVVRAATQF